MERDRMNLNDCRHQSYDSQGTMTDVFPVLKSKILDQNALAVFGSVLLTLLLWFVLCCLCENPNTIIPGTVECLFDHVLCLTN
jgi:hypothetical protein